MLLAVFVLIGVAAGATVQPITIRTTSGSSIGATRRVR